MIGLLKNALKLFGTNFRKFCCKSFVAAVFFNILPLKAKKLILKTTESTTQIENGNLISAYPSVHYDNTELEAMHGIKICDPYRWLEDVDTNPNVLEYAGKLTDCSNAYFNSLPMKEAIEESFKQFNDYVHINGIYATKRENFFYCIANVATGADPTTTSKSVFNNRWSIYVTEDLNVLPGTLLLDASELLESDEEFVLPFYWSHNAMHCAYRIKKLSGSTNKIKVCTHNGTILADTLLNCFDENMQITWNTEGDGFFYMKFFDDEKRQESNWALHYHHLETPQEHDILFKYFNEERLMKWQISLFKPDLIFPSHLGYCMHVRGMNRLRESLHKCVDEKWIGTTVLFNQFILKKFGGHNHFELIRYDEEERTLLVITDYGMALQDCDAKLKCNKMIVRTTLRNARRGPAFWKIIVHRKAGTQIESACEIASKKLLLVKYRENYNMLNVYAYQSESGQVLYKLNAPDEYALNYCCNNSYCIIMTSSYIKPTQFYKYSLNSDDLESTELTHQHHGRQLLYTNSSLPYFCPETGLGILSGYEHRRFRLNCNNSSNILSRVKNTRRKVFFILDVFCEKSLSLNGTHPVLMLCYGGFGGGLAPMWEPTPVLWMHTYRGILAIVHPRGDGFLHKHAMGTEKKQNTYRDIIAATEFLIEKKYTRPKRIAIYGASNGAISSMACATMRPDLFSVAVGFAGPYDLLRSHLIANGKWWIKEYGNGDVKKDFLNMMSYSPLYNFKSILQNHHNAPAILLLTGEEDKIVSPVHTLKYIASLQDCNNHQVRGIFHAQIYKNTGHFYPALDDFPILLFILQNIH